MSIPSRCTIDAGSSRAVALIGMVLHGVPGANCMVAVAGAFCDPQCQCFNGSAHCCASDCSDASSSRGRLLDVVVQLCGWLSISVWALTRADAATRFSFYRQYIDETGGLAYQVSLGCICHDLQFLRKNLIVRHNGIVIQEFL